MIANKFCFYSIVNDMILGSAVEYMRCAKSCCDLLEEIGSVMDSSRRAVMMAPEFNQSGQTRLSQVV